MIVVYDSINEEFLYSMILHGLEVCENLSFDYQVVYLKVCLRTRVLMIKLYCV